MRSGKLIDISKSSLISLKAELTRKQEEIKKVKEQEPFVKLPPKPKPEIKTNPGVKERNENDLKLSSEEVDLLKKSREVLEIKASLYDKCQKGELVPKDGTSHYLVDFGRKSPERKSPQRHSLDQPPSFSIVEPNQEEPESEGKVNEDQSDDYDLDSDEWVEYTDCLGRTRTCHHSDLSMMKGRDKSLANQLNVVKNDPVQSTSDLNTSQFQERELISKDMHLEELRKKWEEQEKKLMNKEDVHYEDILFDEARSHGVGYWAFSTDAEKRAAEQEMFKKVRAETEQRQQEAASLRRRRDEQRQGRLIAARERQRARLGLPPISAEDLKESVATDAEEVSIEKDDKHNVQEEKADDLQRKLMRAAHVRPWDVGKDGVKEQVMTQEEWIEKQRSERNEEFAPLPSSSSTINIKQKFEPLTHPRKPLHKKVESDTTLFTKSEPVISVTQVNESRNVFSSRNEAIYGENRGLGVEIPPPSDLQTAGPSGKRKFTTFEDTAAAIEAGLKYLREEHEKAQNAPTKGAYNMI